MIENGIVIQLDKMFSTDIKHMFCMIPASCFAFAVTNYFYFRH